MLAGDARTELLVLVGGRGGRCGSRLTWAKMLPPEQSPADVCVQIPKTVIQEDLQ